MRDQFDKETLLNSRNIAEGRVGAHLDQGLRSYMITVYNYMALGLGLTGLVAFFVASQPALLHALLGTPLRWVVMLAPLGMVFFLSARIHALRASTAQLLFWVYSGTVGLSLASIFLLYTGTSIARVFFTTGALFASMSLYGYTTKRDLTSFGSFFVMGLWGVVIASLVNLFLQSSSFHFLISAVTVLVFTGLTAYDTQNIKMIYREHDSADTLAKKALMGALMLYLDFLNIFVALLSLTGDRR